ncbi:uncharacterized protein LOC129742513 [Uranotaenia lowii]|uniref:uncharacterized protein LOC129742513 n=1 Tax=Uranotaenia lowii TaxID=190385 RepID=UPI002479A2DB|nr:uncharacterized protein LOC129742513 [Uranotaenia lowii]
MEDCKKLQNDLDAFSAFVNGCKLKVNISKCSTISFTRSNTPILFRYSLGGDDIQRVSSVLDLGVTLDSGLSFRDHINNLVSDGLALFGVVRRFAGESEDPYTIKSLYVSLRTDIA